MEWLTQILPEKYLYVIGWLLIHAIWQIAGIGLLLWAGLQLSQKKHASIRYRMSIAAMGSIVICSLLTGLYYANDSPIAYQQIQNFEFSAGIEDIRKPADTPYSQPIEKASFWENLTHGIEASIPTLVNLWFFGALLFLFKLASSLADLRYMRSKNHELVASMWQEILENKIQQLKLSRPVQLMKSIHVDLPLTYGVLKPVILIPAGLFLQLHPAQLEAIIAHELAHIKRNDFLVNLFQSFLEVIFFFHPVFWWINKTVREEREHACDDMAIEMGTAPKDLAYGLANVLNEAHTKAPEMAMTAFKKPQPTLDRIKRIMGIKPTQSKPTTLTMMTMMLILMLSATLMVSADKSNLSDPDILSQEMGLEEGVKPLEGQETFEAWNNLKEENLTLENNGGLHGNHKNFTMMDTAKKAETQKIILNFDTIRRTDSKDWMFLESVGPLSNHFEFEMLDMSKMPELNMIPLPAMPPLFLEEMPKFQFNEEAFGEFFSDTLLFGRVPGVHAFKMGPGYEFTRIPGIQSFKMDSTSSPLVIRGLITSKDTSDMTKEEIESMKLRIKGRVAEVNEERKAYYKQWQEEHKERMAELQARQKEFQEKQQPKIAEYQAQIRAWHKANEPLIEEYQEQIKAWQEENQPKIEAFQKQMEVWQKENEEQMKSFQEKMEIWQKKNEEQLKAIQQLIEEKVKKGED